MSASGTLSHPFLPSTVKSKKLPSNSARNFTLKFLVNRTAFLDRRVRPPGGVVVARAGWSHCEPSSSSLNAPLVPSSETGKYLSRVFQNERQSFHAAVADELKLLADDRDGAVARMFLSSASDEAFLHRRIAQLKESECQLAVEDVMYMLILYKFSEIRVPLVPKLSRCMYNGRLEIWPSQDWALESIHSFEVLEMVKEHISTVIGLSAKSSVSAYWATTEVQRLQLGRLYMASILYGYFLKSASLRHHLEQSLALAPQDGHLGCRTALHFPLLLPYGLTNLVLGPIGNAESTSSGQGPNREVREDERLKCYVIGFDAETLQRCAKLKSKEAVILIEKQSLALFGDEQTGLLENDEVIMTSFSSLKRLILEAVAFGCFLWDTEDYVNSVYELKDNL